ncbi:gephyrin-like molybdotransferase Glp [Rhodoferax sp.]|uniref:molybdopterin molybdotransferase MoeA n=1 Tax=Rhodoferax sp. TaxID=50421 RepID=UPI00374CA5EC
MTSSTKTTADIAASVPGYDAQDLSISAASAFLAALAQPVAQTEDVAIFAALGRVLAHDVVSPVNVPPHDNSAMDGYAFDGALLSGPAPLTLRVVGGLLAGQGWQGALAAGDCVKIMTGAPLPAGLDTVVPHERVTLQGDSICFDPTGMRRGANRRLAGEDVRQGQPALRQGDRLAAAALGLLASLGLATVTVFRRLRVAYFSTGDEILSLGEAPRPGAVFDSNRYTVFGLLTRLGVETIDLGVVRDDPALLRAAFLQAAQQADAILTSGGMSLGDADHTRSLLAALGDVVFWQLAIRPGRPMAAGRISDLQENNAAGAGSTCATSYINNSKMPAVLFGLPGNPVAVMVAFLALVRPALLQMMGSNAASAAPAPLLQARSLQPIRKRPGRTEYQRGIVEAGADGQLSVRLTGHQGSGVLSSMVQANGLVVLAHDQGDVAAGDSVAVMLLEN